MGVNCAEILFRSVVRDTKLSISLSGNGTLASSAHEDAFVTSSLSLHLWLRKINVEYGPRETVP